MASRPQACTRFQRFADAIEECLLESRLACAGFCDRSHRENLSEAGSGRGRCKRAVQWFRSAVSPVDDVRDQTNRSSYASLLSSRFTSIPRIMAEEIEVIGGNLPELVAVWAGFYRSLLPA
jgi:hypothetical protein